MNELKKTNVQLFVKSCEFYIASHVHSSISIEIYRHQMCLWKKRKTKVGHKRDNNYRFRFVLPFRKFLFILVTLWAQHYFRHHRYGSFVDTAVRFVIRLNRCIAKNIFVLYMREANSSLFFFLIFFLSSNASKILVSTYRDFFMRLAFLYGA